MDAMNDKVSAVQAKAVIVYATFPDIESARKVAGSLIEARIAACVNLLPSMTSVYRWEGEVETASEVVMIVKTTQAACTDVIKAIEASHPYDTPAVVAFDINAGSKRYLDWIATEATP